MYIFTDKIRVSFLGGGGGGLEKKAGGKSYRPDSEHFPMQTVDMTRNVRTVFPFRVYFQSTRREGEAKKEMKLIFLGCVAMATKDWVACGCMYITRRDRERERESEWSLLKT